MPSYLKNDFFSWSMFVPANLTTDPGTLTIAICRASPGARIFGTVYWERKLADDIVLFCERAAAGA